MCVQPLVTHPMLDFYLHLDFSSSLFLSLLQGFLLPVSCRSFRSFAVHWVPLVQPATGMKSLRFETDLMLKCFRWRAPGPSNRVRGRGELQGCVGSLLVLLVGWHQGGIVSAIG